MEELSRTGGDRIDVQVAGGDPVVVRVAGRVLFDTLAPLADALSGLVGAGRSRVVLDLDGVPMCDSSALSMLVRTQSQLTGAGGWLRLAATRPMVDTVLDITNLTRILPVYATAADAVADGG